MVARGEIEFVAEYSPPAHLVALRQNEHKKRGQKKSGKGGSGGSGSSGEEGNCTAHPEAYAAGLEICRGGFSFRFIELFAGELFMTGVTVVVGIGVGVLVRITNRVIQQ